MELKFEDGRYRCECQTQQGTRIDMPSTQCQRMMKAGWFNFASQKDRYPDIEPYVPHLDTDPQGEVGERGSSRSEPAPPPPQSPLTAVTASTG